MKIKMIFILLGALAWVNVNAETIDSYAAVGSPGAANTATKVCVKIPFIKRNAGTLVTGLSTAKLKPYQAIETSVTTTGSVVKRNFGFLYSLAATTQPGLYDICVQPTGVGMVWRRPGYLQHSYLINGIILGAVAADNGLFTVSLQ